MNKIYIAHLYYDLMNLYGENGNIMALVNAIENQDMYSEVVNLSINDKIVLVMGNEGNAGKCNGCGKCLRKCPQNLDIVSELKKVKKEFEFPGMQYILLFVRHVGLPIYKHLIKLLNR